MSTKIIVGTVAGLAVLAGGAIVAARMGTEKPEQNETTRLANVQGDAVQVEKAPVIQPRIILDEREIPETPVDGEGAGANDRNGFQRNGGQFGDRQNMMADMLARFDTDGDGELSEEERQAAREAFRADREARRQQWLLEQYDKDGDGVLSAEEEAQREADEAEREAEREARRAEAQQKALAAYDSDGDGVLSDAEKQAGRDARRDYMMQQREAMTARFDANGDGEITGDERRMIGETMRSVFGEMQFVRQFDSNGDNSITVADMPAYMDLFYASDRQADVNRDGVVDEADLADFQQRALTPPNQDLLDAMAAFNNAPPPVDGEGDFGRGRGGPGGGGFQRGGGDTRGGSQQRGGDQQGRQRE